MQTTEHIMLFLIQKLDPMIRLQNSETHYEKSDYQYEIDSVKKEIPGFLLPDAIRMYTGPREYSHFEKGKDSQGDMSYMKFPRDLKSMTRESIQESLKTNGHLVARPAAVVGEQTDLQAALRSVSNLPPVMICGIMGHLVQDYKFDTLVRLLIDCSHRYDDHFKSNITGKEMNGKETRIHIQEIENALAIIMAKFIYQQTGITCNQKFFEDTIYPIIKEAYPEDLAENTCKYMKLDPKANKQISDHTFEVAPKELSEAIVPYMTLLSPEMIELLVQTGKDKDFIDGIDLSTVQFINPEQAQRRVFGKSVSDFFFGPSREDDLCDR